MVTNAWFAACSEENIVHKKKRVMYLYIHIHIRARIKTSRDEKYSIVARRIEKREKKKRQVDNTY